MHKLEKVLTWSTHSQINRIDPMVTSKALTKFKIQRQWILTSIDVERKPDGSKDLSLSSCVDNSLAMASFEDEVLSEEGNVAALLRHFSEAWVVFLFSWDLLHTSCSWNSQLLGGREDFECSYLASWMFKNLVTSTPSSSTKRTLRTAWVDLGVFIHNPWISFMLSVADNPMWEQMSIDIK